MRPPQNRKDRHKMTQTMINIETSVSNISPEVLMYICVKYNNNNPSNL